MLRFVPAVRLRELGLHTELPRYEEFAKKLNSVDRLVGMCIYRFLCDGACPALFIQIPDEGDEPIPNMVWEGVYSREKLIKILKNVSKLKPERSVSVVKLSDKVLMFVKTDFSKGDWETYGYYIEGDEGVSVPAWKIALEK